MQEKDLSIVNALANAAPCLRDSLNMATRSLANAASNCGLIETPAEVRPCLFIRPRSAENQARSNTNFQFDRSMKDEKSSIFVAVRSEITLLGSTYSILV